jgi:hypothetical protein
MKNTKVKDAVLFAYVVLTVLGSYTAFVFYAGTKAHADNAPQVVVIQKHAVTPSK